MQRDSKIERLWHAIQRARKEAWALEQAIRIVFDSMKQKRTIPDEEVYKRYGRDAPLVLEYLRKIDARRNGVRMFGFVLKLRDPLTKHVFAIIQRRYPLYRFRIYGIFKVKGLEKLADVIEL